MNTGAGVGGRFDHTVENLPDTAEQLQVQLAGCLTAAEGATSVTAKQGDYGWSPAYQAVLDLRIKYDELNQHGLALKCHSLENECDALRQRVRELEDTLAFRPEQEHP